MNIWFQQNISPLKKKRKDYWTSHMHNFAENRTTYFIDAVVHRYIFCLILFFGLYFRKKEILKETVAHLGGVDLRLANRINWMERRNKINHRKKKKKKVFNCSKISLKCVLISWHFLWVWWSIPWHLHLFHLYFDMFRTEQNIFKTLA